MSGTVLVTGSAGFIGSHLVRVLLSNKYDVIGVDSLNQYYDVRVKHRRLAELKAYASNFENRYSFYHVNVNNREEIEKILQQEKPTTIVHLAAQAGVRYCQTFPEEANLNNVEATKLLIELVNLPQYSFITHFLFASSSSIYGCHERPWRETLEPKPIGFYAESKVKGEHLCQAAFNAGQGRLSVSAMRFFTVYGPTGRPDMAPAKFLDIIHRNQTVPVYGDGSAIRDFTFVKDIINGIVLIIQHPDFQQFQVYNLGKGTEHPNSVLDLIQAIEVNLNKKARVEFSECREGDVPATQACIAKAVERIGYQPSYSLEDGIKETVEYYLRHDVEKYIVVVVIVETADQLNNAIQHLNEQTVKPQLVIVIDHSSSLGSTKIPVTFSCSIDFSTAQKDSTWSTVSQIIERRLAEKESSAWEEPSNIFVTMKKEGASTWSIDRIQRYVEEISDRGYELLGNNDDFLVRYDVLREVQTTNNLDVAKPDFLDNVFNTLSASENVRKNVHS